MFTLKLYLQVWPVIYLRRKYKTINVEIALPMGVKFLFKPKQLATG